jgi:hypothetical protein
MPEALVICYFPGLHERQGGSHTKITPVKGLLCPSAERPEARSPCCRSLAYFLAMGIQPARPLPQLQRFWEVELLGGANPGSWLLSYNLGRERDTRPRP